MFLKRYASWSITVVLSVSTGFFLSVTCRPATEEGTGLDRKAEEEAAVAGTVVRFLDKAFFRMPFIRSRHTQRHRANRLIF